MRVARLQHRFVEYMPEEPEAGVLYVSVEFSTVIHTCCCGCGNQVVTPLSPTDWQLTYDGESISLHPSIGNWSFDCRSHYWIKNNRVSWAPAWTRAEIDAGRTRDRARKQQQFDDAPLETVGTPASTPEPVTDGLQPSLWVRVWRWLFWTRRKES